MLDLDVRRIWVAFLRSSLKYTKDRMLRLIMYIGCPFKATKMIYLDNKSPWVFIVT